MSNKTNIQWCDSTVNPVMGCAGCELYPSPQTIMKAIDEAMVHSGIAEWKTGMARYIFDDLLAKAHEELVYVLGEPGPGHLNQMTTTNIRHLRTCFGAEIAKLFGTMAGKLAVSTIERNLSYYAAQLHANRGYNIAKPSRKVNPGYAPTFEQITTYPGRLAAAAKLPDLTV